MKRINNIWVIIFLMLSFSVYGEDVIQLEEMIYPDFEFSYLKDTNQQKLLKVRMTYFSDDKQVIPIFGAKINFFQGPETSDLIETLNTNEDGWAILNVTDKNLQMDDENFYHFRAAFDGSDFIDVAEGTLDIQDITIQISSEVIDNENYVNIKVFKTLADGSTEPVGDEGINVYVPRMFSDLQIAEEWLDENGEVASLFPNNLPGDLDGAIRIKAKIADHEYYGTVESIMNSNWGIPSNHAVPHGYRALWTEIAPSWMIYTLTILLLGVWGHYIYAIIMLIKLKKLGSQSNLLKYKLGKSGLK